MILHDWPLDDRCYAARLGASLMGVGIAERTDAAARVDGPVLDTGDAMLRGTLPILAFLAQRADDPGWATGDAGACSWAEDLLSRFSARRRAIMHAATPGGMDGASVRPVLRALEDALCVRRAAGDHWIGGEHPCILDIALFPVAALAHDTGAPCDLHPGLRPFVRAMRARPGFVTMPGIAEYH